MNYNFVTRKKEKFQRTLKNGILDLEYPLNEVWIFLVLFN